MPRRILILLGETPSSLSARRYAFGLAQSVEAQIAGLAGIVLSYIESLVLGRVAVQLHTKLSWNARLISFRLNGFHSRAIRLKHYARPPRPSNW